MVRYLVLAAAAAAAGALMLLAFAALMPLGVLSHG
jgi:hypothetical protein